MSYPSMALTGATGQLGGLIAQRLAERKVSLRLLARKPQKAPDIRDAVAIRSTYTDDDSTRESLANVDVLFMVSGAESADRLDQHCAFVDAAAAAGVGHIVYTSFNAAAHDAVFTLARDHWATEQHIIDRGLRYTFLRNSLYTDVLPELVGDDGVLRGPAGEGRLASVTRADIAAVAAVVLQDPAAHLGATYTLTGPEALTLTEVAEAISEATGRTVSFHNETVAEAYESRRRWDAPQWECDAWVSTYLAIAAGDFGDVTDDVCAITGRDPQSLRSFLRQRC
ncbi:SDR family oxidoreductase [Mycolicibacterium austroafricanum]|uniref:SDR family oxidoreductase n=1 Tax=Mycolicibacterium austroafricanum TaxID=39687 RepID=UPI000563D20D|nr:SDR family oxidoreductase [Mycolicibacterium austroafricanum]QZY47031.1 SDR family oxidoreductase [Mycolicibacterium austroafricanum]